MGQASQATTAVAIAPARQSLVEKFAGKFGVEPEKMLATLRATAFKQREAKPGAPPPPVVTNEHMMALLVVADQYGLNPWTREIYAFADSQSGIVPVVGVDGWSRIINERPELDGIQFNEAEPVGNAPPAWIECAMFRKDRRVPIVVREYLTECRRNTPAWGSHPRRMLRHRALIQCARVAFGFAGLADPDEADRIVNGEARVVESGANLDELNERMMSRSSRPDYLPIGQDAKTTEAETASSTPVGSKPDQEQGVAAASDESARAAGEVAQPEGDAPARLTYAQIMDALKSATTIDGIDQVAADHLEGYSNVAQRKELVAEYKRLRAAIEAQQ